MVDKSRIQGPQKLGRGVTENIHGGVIFGEGKGNTFHYKFGKEG